MCAVRVVVLDHRRLLREVLAGLLDVEVDIEVVAAVARMSDMPLVTDGIDVLLVGATNEPALGLSAAGSRVVDFTDQESLGQLVDAIRTDETTDSGPRPTPPGPRLTPREVEVVQGIADGLRNEQIAATMGISPKSVENHKQRIFVKLGVRSQAHAVAVALRTGSLQRAGLVG